MTDIIIGARKPRPKKSRRIIYLAVAVGLVYVALRWSVSMWTSYPNPDPPVARDVIRVDADEPKTIRFANASSSLAAHDAVLTVRAEGTPAEIGTSVGRLLEPQLAERTDVLAETTRRAQVGSDLFARFLGRRRGDWLLRTVDDGIPGHQLIEVAGLAKGGSANYTNLVRAQAAYDIGRPDPDTDGAALRQTTRAITVVSSLAGAAGQRVLVGRSFELPGVPGESRPVVRFFRPDGVIPFVSVGDVANVGVVTGLNAEGLLVAAHPLTTDDSATADAAQPTPLLVRDILENARSAEQALAVLEAATPLGSAIYVIADAASRSAVIVERTPRRLGVLPESSGSQVIVDLLTSAELADDPESERNRRSRPDVARADRVRERIAKSAPRTPADLVDIMRDTGGPGGAELPLGHRAQIADPSAAHVVVLDAAALVIWVSSGPGPFGRFVAYDLRHELRREGKRPAPPPDIAADESMREQAALVKQARALVYQAKRLGRRTAARETLARALALAPDLPEAVALADELGVTE